MENIKEIVARCFVRAVGKQYVRSMDDLEGFLLDSIGLTKFIFEIETALDLDLTAAFPELRDCESFIALQEVVCSAYRSR